MGHMPRAHTCVSYLLLNDSWGKVWWLHGFMQKYLRGLWRMKWLYALLLGEMLLLLLLLPGSLCHTVMDICSIFNWWAIIIHKRQFKSAVCLKGRGNLGWLIWWEEGCRETLRNGKALRFINHSSFQFVQEQDITRVKSWIEKRNTQPNTHTHICCLNTIQCWHEQRQLVHQNKYQHLKMTLSPLCLAQLGVLCKVSRSSGIV